MGSGEQVDEEECLNAFRDGLSCDDLRSELKAADCKRFLRARKWDVEKALEMVGAIFRLCHHMFIYALG